MNDWQRLSEPPLPSCSLSPGHSGVWSTARRAPLPEHPVCLQRAFWENVALAWYSSLQQTSRVIGPPKSPWCCSNSQHSETVLSQRKGSFTLIFFFSVEKLEKQRSENPKWFYYLKFVDWYFGNALLSLVLTSRFHSSVVKPSQSSNVLKKRKKLLLLRDHFHFLIVHWVLGVLQ